MISDLKTLLFTVTGLLCTLMHLVFFAGVLGLYIFISVQMGEDREILKPVIASKR